jgi:hypothetical protein
MAGRPNAEVVLKEPITGDPQQSHGWFSLGFGLYRLTHVTGYSYTAACPLWLLLIAFSISPPREAIRFMRLSRIERRRAAGLCTDCGYDLRGSQERCPECGAISAEFGGGRVEA